MCGRYAFYQRPSEVRHRLQQSNMQVDDTPPDDDSVRSSYNFCPGYNGLVYRADVPDYGAGPKNKQHTNSDNAGKNDVSHDESYVNHDKIGYKLQAMKWGLIPFWTKTNPGYGSLMKTINCRDDSLAIDKGMWTTMKKRKRCIVICQGFYEWLSKNNGKDKIPYYITRKDSQLLLFAGLWDAVKYEGEESTLYTYTIITTDSNQKLKFLHDRMPVLFDPGSQDLYDWLNPNQNEWTKDLQNLLHPFQGELDVYPVSKDVNKVGNNSSSFIIPIDSIENKNNIANFFKKQSESQAPLGKEESRTEISCGVKREFDETGIEEEKEERKTPIKAMKKYDATKNTPKTPKTKANPVSPISSSKSTSKSTSMSTPTSKTKTKTKTAPKAENKISDFFHKS